MSEAHNVLTDVDECSLNSPCREICENNDGGYTCGCPEGKAVDPDDKSKCVRKCNNMPCKPSDVATCEL